MMNDNLRFKDTIKNDPSSGKLRQLQDKAKASVNTGSRRWAWPDDHNQYDWMDHFSPPDISEW
jgi:hypothetical protein